MDLKLRGRVALVTGAHRGTGRGIARVLAAEGASVLVHGFERAATERAVSELSEAGGDLRGVVGDLLTQAGADALASEVLAEASRVDILVNNYGVAEGPGWLDGRDEDWLLAYQKNVLSGVRLVRSFVPGMRERGFGRVIFVSTIGAVRPRAAMPHYYAAKATLANIAISLAQELAGTGITVNTVSPGLVATDEVKASMLRRGAERGWGTTWEEIEPHAARSFFDAPAGFVGTPEDVGQLVAFLASELARYVDGATIKIDGGASGCVG
jgi:NAD(P)-dependent dehydrogenase (short-subunit alcohol dehydrogenase family)